ncbi:MAG: hypothetical protein ACREOF_12470 [Gemmatimonadales bacterium]
MTGVTLEAGTALLALGAVHGLNPGMGWLFAVALGLQERSRRAVWRAFPPLAIGHAAAIALAVAAAAVAGGLLATEQIKWLVAALLVAFGAYRLVRHRHPRGGMRVGARDLAIWSLLMATAHGAGLMALPFVLNSSVAGAHAGHAADGGLMLAGMPSLELPGLWATLIHSGGYLVATIIVAGIVYEKLGLGVLRRLWVNVDLVWSAALIATGIVTPFV